MKNRLINTEYTFIGAGPANIITIVHLIAQGVNPKDITLIGDQKGGAFANDLSRGSSVPGNTSAGAYIAMYDDLFNLYPALRPPENKHFALYSEKAETACSLDMASEPLRHIVDVLCTKVNFEEGRVTKLVKTDSGFIVEVKPKRADEYKYFATQDVILGTGGKPREKELPKDFSDIKVIKPDIAFIKSELNESFAGKKLKVAVIGSSHSAALATLHLLEEHHTVVQFMDKEYLYAETIYRDGIKTTIHDDTGLKGDVARLTKKLLAELAVGKSPYQHNIERYIGKDRAEVDVLLKKHLEGCTHVVSTIGYDPVSIEFEGSYLSRDNHDSKTMQFFKKMGNTKVPIKGLYGNGIAFAETVNNAQSNGLTKYHRTSAKIAQTLISNHNKRIELELSKKAQDRLAAQLRLFKQPPVSQPSVIHKDTSLQAKSAL